MSMSKNAPDGACSQRLHKHSCVSDALVFTRGRSLVERAACQQPLHRPLSPRAPSPAGRVGGHLRPDPLLILFLAEGTPTSWQPTCPQCAWRCYRCLHPGHPLPLAAGNGTVMQCNAMQCNAMERAFGWTRLHYSFKSSTALQKGHWACGQFMWQVHTE